MTSGQQPEQAVGFLTVLEHDQFGLVGGYLILNTAGRPLEFHCTAPVKPNRAQQILFGPTLESYLYGEQIGQTLLTKAGIEPLAVCTDVKPALAVRDYVALPVALVLADAADAVADGASASVEASPGAAAPVSVWRIDPPHRSLSQLEQFVVGRNRLAVAPGRAADRELIVPRLQSLDALDLCEPFGRIREAIEEAHKTARV